MGTDKEVISCQSPTPGDISLHIKGKHTGPTLKAMSFDFVGGKTSLWTMRAIQLLAGKLHETLQMSPNLPSLSMQYVESVVWTRFDGLDRCWRKWRGINEKGDCADEDQAMHAYLRAHDSVLIKSRRNSRRQRVMRFHDRLSATNAQV